MTEEEKPDSIFDQYATGLSQAFWCSYSAQKAIYEEAMLLDENDKQKNICWFDMLFEGGILLPKSKDCDTRPMTLLLMGPPGSGKSTLAMELCYRLALNRKMKSLYISIDTETDRMIEKACSFGWKEASSKFIRYDSNLNRVELSNVLVWGREMIGNWDDLADIVEFAVESVYGMLKREAPNALINFARNKSRMETVAGSSNCEADVMVIDSLNIVEPEQREKFFDQFLKVTYKGTRLIIFILDSGTEDAKHRYWEYVCDNVIRLDSSYERDYYLRTIEVLKSRYQVHVLGKQQLKIYSRPKIPLTDDLAKRRNHPYREEGGIFIFPSIHYYLSRYKRRTPSGKPEYAETYPEKLNQIVRLPEGRCTAFIGQRGGHKSHLAYLHLLYRMTHKPENQEEEENEKGLVISLRDDEGITKNTLQRILKEEFPQQYREHYIDECERSNQFEVLYYPPGYITPEEFFHRMFMSIHRLKTKHDTKLTVIFNSLDQLSARFPLCAKQEIFIPGIIESLLGEGITSIFIAVDEPGQPIEQYGLLPMSDLIMSFKRYNFDFKDYVGHIRASWEGMTNSDLDMGLIKKFDEGKLDAYKNRESVVIDVVRFSGGQKGGAKGLLELVGSPNVPQSEIELFTREGLHFTPLSPQHGTGKTINENEPGTSGS